MVRGRGGSGGGWRLWAIAAREGSTGTIEGRLAQGVRVFRKGSEWHL